MTPAEARRVLGLGRDDQDTDRLRRAYRRAVRQHHPDRPEGDAVRFRESVRAFELLAVTFDQGAGPGPSAPEASPQAGGLSPEPVTRLDLLVTGLDRLGEVTYLDRSLGLVEGVLPQPGGALQILIVGGTGGTARVVDVVRLDGGDAPSADEIHQLLTEAATPN